MPLAPFDGMKRWMLWTASGIVGCLVACSGSTITPGSSASSGGVGADGGEGGDGGASDSSTSDGGPIVEPIAAKDFDQSCTTKDDCVLVTEGDVCAICSCPNAAIAKKDADAYNAKRSELSQACGPRPAIGCGVDCIQTSVSCSSAGKCVVVDGPGDGG